MTHYICFLVACLAIAGLSGCPKASVSNPETPKTPKTLSEAVTKPAAAPTPPLPIAKQGAQLRED